jgi:hypothetical protein
VESSIVGENEVQLQLALCKCIIGNEVCEVTEMMKMDGDGVEDEFDI